MLRNFKDNYKLPVKIFSQLINFKRLKVDALINSGVKIEKVVVSPMTRTLQTAWGTFNGYNIPFQVIMIYHSFNLPISND